MCPLVLGRKDWRPAESRVRARGWTSGEALGTAAGVVIAVLPLGEKLGFVTKVWRGEVNEV